MFGNNCTCISKNVIFTDTPEEEGSAIFYDLPSDPEDETADLCTLSSQPLFPTQRITADGGKRYV